VLAGEDANRAAKVLDELKFLYRQGMKITAHEVNYAVELVKSGDGEQLHELFADTILVTAKGKHIRPKTLGQRDYLEVIRKNDITFGIGPAGTGKTYLAVVTAVAALKAFDTAKHIYLLVGGYDRQQDYSPLLDYVAENASKITLLTLPVTGNRIFEVAKARHLTCLKTAGISEAVQIAKSMAKAGEVVLLSPAAPSYHAYKNFEARGDDFAQNVNC